MPSETAIPGANVPVKQPEQRCGTPHSALKWLLVALPLVYLWGRLIDNLRLEWSTNPQYSFGWLVPLLCIGLVLRRVQSPSSTFRTSVSRPLSAFRFSRSAFFLLAFLYLPTRLIEAATPEWRPIQWLLGTETIGLTLCAIWLIKEKAWFQNLFFPIAFFFVAIPWPTLIEQPIIQTLTRASAVVVIEVMNWIGVPAIPHGNVIEVATGTVGIDEACSGIRSFQSSLMISLFLGEFYRFNVWRRLVLLPIGFVFSLAFNVCRMSLLTWVAAKKGVSAIAEYHDPAGLTITVACTLGLWAIAAWMKWRSNKFRTQNPEPESQNPESVSTITNHPSPTFHVSRFTFQPSTHNFLFVSLIAWLICVEFGVQFWYYRLESNLQPGPEWSLSFPHDNATLKDLPVTEKARFLLRFDEGKQAAWTEPDGTQWQAYYFDWKPGRVAGYLAKRHTPEICLQATGLTMRSGPDLTLMTVHGVQLPMRSYVFDTPNGPLNVFHCRWEAGAQSSAYVQHESGRFNLVRAIWAGRGNKGQKVVEIIVSGIDDPKQAQEALARQLEKLITVNK